MSVLSPLRHAACIASLALVSVSSSPAQPRAVALGATQSASDLPQLAAIHFSYLRRDGATHTRLLRGALREARRLVPEVCVERQRNLLSVGGALGFDGLESLWLIYQDCAAQGSGPILTQAREENARLLQKNLR